MLSWAHWGQMGGMACLQAMASNRTHLQATTHPIRFSDIAWNNVQIEDHQPIVFQNAAIARTQMPRKTRVLLEPPKRRPADYHESNPGSAMPLQLIKGALLIRWRTPPLPILLQKRNSAASRRDPAELIEIGEYESFPFRN